MIQTNPIHGKSPSLNSDMALHDLDWTPKLQMKMYSYEKTFHDHAEDPQESSKDGMSKGRPPYG